MNGRDFTLELAEMFTKGGYVMYLLLICSIIVVAIGIERFRFYKYASNNGENFLQQVSERVNNQRDAEEILSFCRGEKGNAGAILRVGLEALINGKNVELAVNTLYDEEAMKLRARLNYLSMIVTLAPLLGLLGTILGMIEAFNIFSIQAGQPLAITGGIGEALIATATGLCVAILALIVHTYFAQKLDEILSEMEKAASIVLSMADERNKS